MTETQLTLEQLETILDAFSVESTDFSGIMPVDLQSINLCDPDADNEVSVPSMSMEDIEALCNSDFILNLLDLEKMETVINNMVDDINNKMPNNSSDDLLGKIEGNYAIIEFGDDYTNGDKVEYNLTIKPGQKLTSDTILGTIVQRNKQLPLKSIFTTGTVLATDSSNTEFLHLFPSKALRHIIIADYQLGDGIGYDENKFNKIGDDINDNTDLYNLIKDHLCLCTLPLILANHETKEYHEKHPIIMEMLTPVLDCEYRHSTNAITLYNNLMLQYENVINNAGKNIEKIANAKNIKATNGTKSGMNNIKNQLFEVRENIIEQIISLYMPAANKGFNTLPYDEYKDCINLCNIKGKNTNYEKINNTTYGNYYTYLLSCVNPDINKYSKQYYNILSTIINKRALYEKATKLDLIKEFDDLFKTHIRDYTNQEVKLETLGFSIISSNTNDLTDFDTIKGIIIKEADVKLNAIASQLVENYIKIQQMPSNVYYQNQLNNAIRTFNNDYKSNISYIEDNGYNIIDDYVKEKYKNIDTINKDELYQFIKSKADSFINSNDGYQKISVYNRITNIFIYIAGLDYIEDENKLEYTDEFTPLDLVKEEAELLLNFWNSIIQKYKSKNLTDIIDNIDKEIGTLTSYAEWPSPVPIEIEKLKYEHYLFMYPLPDNDKSKYATDGDDDIANYDENSNTSLPDGNAPNISISENEALNALNNPKPNLVSDNDPSDKEITILDTEYWVKYFSLATIISLPFLADGFDIPPTMTPVPLPGIYIAFKAIHIKIFDVLLVIGLAIRGIYISPIILTVNLSDTNVSPLTPLIAILKKIKQMFETAISKIEMTVPNVVELILYKLEMENANYRKQNQMYESLLIALLNLVYENDELLKKNMLKLTHPNLDSRQNILRTNEIDETVGDEE